LFDESSVDVQLAVVHPHRAVQVARGREEGAVGFAGMVAPRLQVIGGGKMGEALFVGLVGKGWAAPDEMCIVEKDPDRAAALRAAIPKTDVTAEPAAAEGQVLAVKPPDVPAVCTALAGAGSTTPVLSIAAGVTIA